jgi:5'(3')-deoxyribonucleotidase
MKQLICVDIDNVLARTDEVMREVIRLCSKDEVDLRYEDIIEFDYWNCVDRNGRCFARTEWENIHTEFTRKYIPCIQPFNGVQEYLRKLSDKFEIHVATSRLSEGYTATKDWLVAHNIPFTELHFVGHRKKHLIPKAFFAAIEDDRTQAEFFHDRGVRAFLLGHPWNVIEASSPLIRVDEWPTLVAKLLETR